MFPQQAQKHHRIQGQLQPDSISWISSLNISSCKALLLHHAPFNRFLITSPHQLLVKCDQSGQRGTIWKETSGIHQRLRHIQAHSQVQQSSTTYCFLLPLVFVSMGAIELHVVGLFWNGYCRCRIRPNALQAKRHQQCWILCSILFNKSGLQHYGPHQLACGAKLQ